MFGFLSLHRKRLFPDGCRYDVQPAIADLILLYFYVETSTEKTIRLKLLFVDDREDTLELHPIVRQWVFRGGDERSVDDHRFIVTRKSVRASIHGDGRQLYRVDIWDSRHALYMRPRWYRDAEAAMVCVNVNDASALRKVEPVIEDIGAKARLHNGDRIPMVLVAANLMYDAGKLDTTTSARAFTDSDFDDFCQSIGLCGWFAVDVKNRKIVKKAFNYVISTMIETQRREDMDHDRNGKSDQETQAPQTRRCSTQFVVSSLLVVCAAAAAIVWEKLATS